MTIAARSIVYERDNLEENIYKLFLDFEENYGLQISHLWIDNWSISYDGFSRDARGEITMSVTFNNMRETTNGN